MAQPREPRAWKGLAELSAVGFAMALSIVIGLALGYYADRWLGTRWLILVGLLLGIAAAFVGLFRSLKRSEREFDESE